MKTNKEIINEIRKTMDYISGQFYIQGPNLRLGLSGNNDLVPTTDTALFMTLTPLVDGKALLTGNPGTGKTTTAAGISQLMFNLTPKDARKSIMRGHPQVTEEKIVGAPHLGRLQKDGEIEVIWNPAVTSCGPLIVDEINRIPGPLQSMLLDGIDTGIFHYMGEPYERENNSGFATTNYEDEGNTELLPPIRDRFDISLYFKPPVGLDNVITQKESLEKILEKPVWDKETLESAKEQIAQIRYSDKSKAYVALLFAELAYNSGMGEIRDGEMSAIGIEDNHDQNYLFGSRKSDASTRFIFSLEKYAQALAFIKGASVVSPEHLRFVAPYILSHRVLWKDNILRDAAQVNATNRDKQPLNFVAAKESIRMFTQRFGEILEENYNKYVDLIQNGNEAELDNWLSQQDHPLYRRAFGSSPNYLEQI